MPTQTKSWKVRLVATCDVLVIDAENEDKAIEFATDEASKGDFEVLDMTAEELKTPEQIASARRHCECVSEDPKD